jgi:hypothetical protein
MKNVPSNLIIKSGKLMINMNNYNKIKKLLIKKILFPKNHILYETEEDHDLVLTNQNFMLTIVPSIFYSYDDNTNNAWLETYIYLFYLNYT